MRTSIYVGMLCVVAAAGALAACGDTEETNTANSTSSSSSAASGGGQGGTSSSVVSSSSAGGAGGQGQGGATGSGGGGGAGGGSNLLNGCDPATAEDHTADAMVTIVFGGALGTVYSPKCVRVKAGTDVTFMGNFAFHPLQGGTVIGMVPTPDPTSPIQNPTPPMAMSATFTLANPGDYPYYCTAHALTGMTGAVFVIP